jgi:hypothetical protein
MVQKRRQMQHPDQQFNSEGRGLLVLPALTVISRLSAFLFLRRSSSNSS